MANIKKNTKTGKWEVRLSLGFDEEGKRIQRFFSDDRKQTVQFWVAEQLRAKQDGSIRKVQRFDRMGDVIDDWLDGYVLNSRAKTTHHSYTSIINQVPEWFRRLKPKDVKPAHCLRMLREWKDAGLAASTVNTRRNTFVGLFSWAKKMGYVQGDNPMAAVQKFTEDYTEHETLTAEELVTYLDTCEVTMANGYRTAIWLITYTGMRAREATALRWSDIDFERKQISVARTAIEVKGGYSFEQTKGKKVRVVTISDELVRYLEKSRVRQKYDMMKFGWRNDEDLVCLGLKGAYVWYSGLRRRHAVTLQTAGLPEVTMHGLRHTHATLLMKAGVHAKVIQERLGHADSKTTMEVYAHVLHTTQTETADTFEQLLHKKKPL